MYNALFTQLAIVKLLKSTGFKNFLNIRKKSAQDRERGSWKENAH